MSDARKIQEGAEWTPDDYGTDAGYRATPSGRPERARPISGIERTIALHRNLAADDAHIGVLVSRQPPTTFDYQLAGWAQEPAAAIGMTVSARLLKYVGHADGFGSDFPWHRALWRLRFYCRKNHEFHRAADRPYWRGSLCQQLVTFVILRGWSVQNAAEILLYDNPEPVLREALQWIEDSIDASRRKAEKQQRDEQGRGPGAVPAPLSEQRHDQPGMHRDDCPQCKAA